MTYIILAICFSRICLMASVTALLSIKKAISLPMTETNSTEALLLATTFFIISEKVLSEEAIQSKLSEPLLKTNQAALLSSE